MGKSRTLVALFLVLACAAQAVLAVSAPCALVGGITIDTTADAGDPVHAGHHMAMDSPAAHPAGDCCDGGYCSLSGCIGLAALADLAGPAPVAPHHAAPDALTPTWPASPTEALFRPPIYG